MEDKYLQQLLGANEKIILITRRHWLFILRNILPELVLILLILAGVTTLWAATPVSGFSALGFLLLFLPFISLARDLLIWHNNKHIVTSRRVIHMSGVWSKNVIDSSLEKVNDVKMEQSALGRVFNYGDIEILTASEIGVNRFARINNPVGLKTAMLNAKTSLNNGDIASSEDIPALIAKLGELHDQGVLTEAEFNRKKAELLAKIG